MVDKELVNVLKPVGFNDKEARAYLAVLELGKGTATEVARRAELKRSIVYYTLRHLEKKGFVQRVPEGKIQRFSAADPSRVLQSVHTATEELRFMLPLMRALHNKGDNKPKIEYFEGKEAILAVYRSFTHKEGVRFLTSIHRLQALIPEEVGSWIVRYQKRKGFKSSKNLLPDTKEDREYARKVRELGEGGRILPPDIRMEMDFSISDDVLSITSFDPLFIVVIHSKAIATSAAQLFDLAWLSGKEVT